MHIYPELVTLDIDLGTLSMLIMNVRNTIFSIFNIEISSWRHNLILLKLQHENIFQITEEVAEAHFR